MILLLFLLICATLFSSCAVVFSEVEIGENFYDSIDGHFKKLPENHCIFVLYGATARLFKVLNENTDVLSDASLWENPILEGHFIKGFYTEKCVVLCEEQENDTLRFFIFDFFKEEAQCYAEESEVLQVLNLDSAPWFALCNTNEQIRAKQ